MRKKSVACDQVELEDDSLKYDDNYIPHKSYNFIKEFEYADGFSVSKCVL